MKEIEVVAAIIQHQNKILCCQRRENKLQYLSEKWEFPGGKLEVGESREAGLLREIKEELTVDLDTTTLSFFATLEAQADGEKEGVTVKIVCYQAKYTGTLAPDSEIEELSWLGFSDMSKCSLVVKTIFEELYALNLIS